MDAEVVLLRLEESSSWTFIHHKIVQFGLKVVSKMEAMQYKRTLRLKL